MAFQMNLPPPQGSVRISIVKQLHCRLLGSIHSKSEKVCRTAFSVKKNCENSLGHFGSFLGHFGPFVAILGHFASYLAHCRPFWVIFGPNCKKKFEFFYGLAGVAILAFRMYAGQSDPV